MNTEPLSLEELNRRRKEIAAVTGGDSTDLNENYPVAPMHKMMLSYLKKYRQQLDEMNRPAPAKANEWTEDVWLRNEIAQMEYMSGETDSLNVKDLIRKNETPQPVIVVEEKTFDLYPSSRSALAERAYESMKGQNSVASAKDLLPMIDAVLESLTEIIREDMARKATAFGAKDENINE